MKARFFAIILTAILLTTSLVTWVHFSYLKSERLNLIDTQIRESASVLVNSDLADLARINLEEAERIISDELGPSRIGKIFVIRNTEGTVVFASSSASALDMDIPRAPKWVTVETPEYFVRVLNLDLPKKPDRTLQVGVALNADFFHWSEVSNRLLIYILIIAAIATLVSWLLSLVLLQPFRGLNRHLAAATIDLKNLRDVKNLPPELAEFGSRLWAKTDEFTSLLNNIQRLIERINQNYRTIRIWATRMAHELKTPLTILRSELDVISRRGGLTSDESKQLTEEIDSISGIVTEFLGWAELEQSDAKGEIHAVKLRDVIFAAQQRFERLEPGRVRVLSVDDTIAIAFPPHVEQLINNLVSNALKYSPKDESVDIEVRHGRLKITDHGGGIPPDVLDRLGQPFNKGVNSYNGNKNSSGLGLAIANSIVRLYQWKLDFTSSDAGTTAQVETGIAEPTMD